MDTQRGARHGIAWGEAAEPQVPGRRRPQPRRGGIRLAEHIREDMSLLQGSEIDGPEGLGAGSVTPVPALEDASPEVFRLALSASPNTSEKICRPSGA